MSNFPLSYRLSWLPRLVKPSLAAGGRRFGPIEARWLQPRQAVRLLFAGDISAVASREPPEVDPSLCALFEAADLVVANCESPVVERPAFPVATRLGLRHAMTPAFVGKVLVAAGIAPARLVLSLANNHALDQGPLGFERTAEALADLGARTIGAAAKGQVQRIDAGPLALGFLAFTQWRNGGAADYAGRVAMTKDVAGGFAVAPSVDVLCAMPHWDREFRHFPQATTRALAGRLTGQGANLIVGGHAHVVQPVERMGQTLVAYGLGDLLGTVMASPPWPLRIGALLSVEMSTDADTWGRVAAHRVIPFLRERQGRRERLRPVRPEDRAAALVSRIFVPKTGQTAAKQL
ncbi:CapA family protein [Mesorhizobium sp. ZMM04-5]|uniref:CapA family protein n=1 Tax=Mesorhizobium marinum TaxID=3228790 RepID=A0ABV3QUB4_9HYPH